MRDIVPPRPTGSTPAAIAARMAWDLKFGPENQLRDSPTVKFRKTSRGIFAEAVVRNVSGGSNKGSSTVAGQWIYPVAFFGNYIVGATQANGGGSYIRAVKPLDLRNSISSNAIDGNIWLFTYPFNPANWDTVSNYPINTDARAFLRRTATYNIPGGGGQIISNEAITPRYQPVGALQSQGGTAEPIFIVPTMDTSTKTVPADTLKDPTTQSAPSAGTVITWQHVGPHHWTRLGKQNA